MKDYFEILKKFNQENEKVSKGMKKDITEFEKLKNKPIVKKPQIRKFNR